MVEWVVPVTDVVVILLLALVGGNLGSFLNVVVHRLPRGESVVTGGSRCPMCGSAIRWHDNVPVFGWLLLGGRCRDCAAEIAPRYPLMEAIGAVVLGGVASAELLSGGGTFPGPAFPGGRVGADHLLLRPDPRLVGMAAFHAWLLFHLLLRAAVTGDGGKMPRRWIIVPLAFTVAVVAACDWLLPVGIRGDVGPPGDAVAGRAVLRALPTSVAGMACGAILGSMGGNAVRDGLAMAGAALGWQAAVTIALIMIPLNLLRRALVSSTAPHEPDGSMPPDGTDDAAPPRSLPPMGGRLAAAVRGALGVEGTAGDLVVATALALVTWRWWAGIWR